MPTASTIHCFELNQLVNKFTFPSYYVTWNHQTKTWNFAAGNKNNILPYNLATILNCLLLTLCLAEIIAFLCMDLVSRSKLLVLGYIMTGIVLHMLVT